MLNIQYFIIQFQRQMDSEDSIQVHVRIRAAQPGIIYFAHSPKEIKLGKNDFAFDQIYSPDIGQTEIFSLTGLKSITHALEGYNSCIFVYGQTGSGKTYTMVGGDGGIIQRAMEHLFYQISETSSVNYVVGCSYYEIYNEQLFDLLDHNEKKKLSIREDIKKGIFIQGLHEENIDTSARGMSLLNQGIRSRHVAETMMNRESSRSHAIFSLNIQSKHISKGSTTLKTSKLHFVDLAGSQRQKASACIGERLKEASNINKSLTTLGMVINSLSSEKSKSHIPFRDSKLTLVLRDSLNGNSKTYLIATISSNPDSFQQTLSTLKFAQRAKMVKLKAQINQESLSMNVQTLKQQIKRLKEENRNILSTLQIQKNKVKPQSELSNYSEAIITNYNNNVSEINEKINCLAELLPKAIECSDPHTMETINDNLTGIIKLRQQIITKAKIENLKFEEIGCKKDIKNSSSQSVEINNMKHTVTSWKNKARELGEEVMEKDKQKSQLFGKIKESIKQIQLLKEQNQIIKSALEAKEGKGVVETVRSLLKEKLNPSCSSCKQADPFIMKLSTDIVTLKKQISSLQLQHQQLNEEHQFLKISYKNLQQESERKIQIFIKEEVTLQKQIQSLLEKKKEDLKGLTCSVNGKQVSAVVLSARVRQLENINLELNSEIEVLRETVEFRNQQIQEMKSKVIVQEKQNKTPLKDNNFLKKMQNIEEDFIKSAQSKDNKISELERELRINLQNLSNSKEEIIYLKRVNQQSRRDDHAYSDLLNNITKEHENLIEATKVIQDELRRKVVSGEKQLLEKTEEIERLKQTIAQQFKVIEFNQANNQVQQYKSKLEFTEQQLSKLRVRFENLGRQLNQTKTSLNIYINSIQSAQINFQARTKQAEELRVINYDLTLKNNRHEFVIKQREDEMFLLHNQLVGKRKEIIEYVEKFLQCQKEKEDVQKRLTQVTLRHEQQLVPLYQQNNRFRQLLREKEQMSSYTSYNISPRSSQIPTSASKAHREQIEQLRRIIGDRDRQYEDVYRMKKEADYRIFEEREEANKSIGVYLNEISLLKEKILELETESLEFGNVKAKYQFEIAELNRQLGRKQAELII